MASRGLPVLPILAGLAGVLGLAAAAYLLLEDGARAPAPEDGDRRVITSPGPSQAPAEDGALPVYVPDEREEPPPAPPPPTGELRGRLVDAYHHPIGRGRVQAMAGIKSLFMAGGAQLKSLGLDPAEVSGDGRFHFSGLPVRTDVTLRIDGDSFVRTEEGPYSVRPGETLDIGDIVTEQGYTIVGSVLDPDGKPVAGAQVQLTYGPAAAMLPDADRTQPERVALTDDEGRFEMSHAPRWQFALTVNAAGYATTSVQGGSPTGGDLSEVEFTIVLERARSLRGLVVSKQDGQPLGDITILAVNEGGTASQSAAVSGRDGRFLFDDLAAGPHRLQADGDGWAILQTKVAAAALDQELVLRMTEESTLSGHVAKPDEEPLARYDLQVLFGNSRTTVDSPTDHTLRVRNNEGRFEVTGLEPGWYRLEVWAKGFALTTTAPIRVQPGQSVDGVAITMQYGATIRGQVLDDLDRPIVGAAVSLHTNNLAQIEFLRVREWKAPWQVTTYTDDEGVFQLADVSERAYQIEVDHPDYPVFVVNDVIAEAGQLAEALTIVVPRPGEISGVAMDSSGQRLRRGTISLGGPVSATAQPDGEGRFRFRRLLPGDYYLDARPAKGELNFSFGEELQRGRSLQPIRVSPGQKVDTTVSTP